MAITTINQENFDDQVTRSSAPVLLDFWAAWCGPCSMLSPVVEELAEEHPEISFGKVNVDEAWHSAIKFPPFPRSCSSGMENPWMSPWG